MQGKLIAMEANKGWRDMQRLNPQEWNYSLLGFQMLNNLSAVTPAAGYQNCNYTPLKN